MSARFPHIAESPSYIQIFHGHPEAVLGICWERGYSTKLIAPDLNSYTMEIEIGATRREVRECHRENYRRVHLYPHSDFAALVDNRPEWQRAYHRGSPHKWVTRIYFEPDTIADVMRENGLAGRIIRAKPHHCFYLIEAVTTLPVWRASQFEWIRRMIANSPTPIPAT